VGKKTPSPAPHLKHRCVASSSEMRCRCPLCMGGAGVRGCSRSVYGEGHQAKPWHWRMTRSSLLPRLLCSGTYTYVASTSLTTYDLDCFLAAALLLLCWPHYHKTEFPWRPKTAKDMFVGGAPSCMNRQVWMVRKALKQGFLDCQPAKESMDIRQIAKRTRK
jgi:hypothetical protein